MLDLREFGAQSMGTPWMEAEGMCVPLVEIQSDYLVHAIVVLLLLLFVDRLVT